MDITVELEREVIFALAMMAHSRDITLNQLVNGILREELEVQPSTE